MRRTFGAPLGRMGLALAMLVVCSCKRADIPPPPAMPESGRAEAPARSAADREIARLSEEYIDLISRTRPELATRWGLHIGDGELDDRSAAGEEARLSALRALLEKVERLEGSEPARSTSAEVDWLLLRGTLRREVKIAEVVRPHERQPDYYTEPLAAIFLLLARDFAPLEERARSALSRLERLPEVTQAAQENLKSPPLLWVKVGVEAARGAKPFLAEVKTQLLAALPAERERITQAHRRAEAAYAGYAKFLEQSVTKRAGAEFASGRDLFEFLLREDYFLRESPEQLKALGEAVFARTERELEQTAKQIDPQASGWAEVISKLKDRHPAAPELLEVYRREVARAREFLQKKGVVDYPAGENCEVVATPEFQRGTIMAAYDQPPPFDRDASGLFYVTPVDPSWSAARQKEWLRENDYGDIVDTVVHETYPGHHLQLSYARLHPSKIRKVVDTAIFAEGWGLYSEELMHELGYYTPEERMLVLEWSLVRAARVILDVSMHVEGMSAEQAVEFMVTRVHLERTLAENEVKRYSQTPTQPLSYMVGREKLFELRERYRARQGESYTLRDFHQQILTRGTLPPALLERELFDAR